jgi:metal-responsive CopG/Arc/MetJ family transcriptional regulator
MAKVMISLPDSLLERIDVHVRAHGTSRSAFLRALAERDLTAVDSARAEEIRRLAAYARPHGGDNVRFIREMRRSR